MKIEPGIQSTITTIDTQIKKTIHTHTPVKITDVPFSVALSSTNEQTNSDEISHDRVAAIRDQLAAGTYNISGKDVANKILGVLKG